MNAIPTDFPGRRPRGPIADTPANANDAPDAHAENPAATQWAALREAAWAIATLAGPDAEAQAALDRLFALAALDAPIRAVQRANTDPYSVMAQTMSRTPRVGSNGGTAAGLVGSYDTVATRIQAFHDAGVRHLVLDFVGPPEDRDAQIDWFAAEVMPRLRSLMGR